MSNIYTQSEKYIFNYSSVNTDIDNVLDASSNPSTTQVSNFKINNVDLYKTYTPYGAKSFIDFGTTGFQSNGVDIGTLFEYKLINTVETTASYVQYPFYTYYLSGGGQTTQGTALIVTTSGNIVFNKSVNDYDLYMIGGGGGGGAHGPGSSIDNAGGGGGGGGYYEMKNITSTDLNKLNCTIGLGGAGLANNVAGTAPSGGNTIVSLYSGTTILGNVSVRGGGGGGSGKGNGASGGSGGGSGSYSSGAPSPGTGIAETRDGIFIDDGLSNYNGERGQDDNNDHGQGGGGGGCSENGGTLGGSQGGRGRTVAFYTDPSTPSFSYTTISFDGGGGGGAREGAGNMGGSGGGFAGDGGNHGFSGNNAQYGALTGYYACGGGGGGGSNNTGGGGNGANGAIVLIIRDIGVNKTLVSDFIYITNRNFSENNTTTQTTIYDGSFSLVSNWLKSSTSKISPTTNHTASSVRLLNNLTANNASPRFWNATRYSGGKAILTGLYVTQSGYSSASTSNPIVFSVEKTVVFPTTGTYTCRCCAAPRTGDKDTTGSVKNTLYYNTQSIKLFVGTNELVSKTFEINNNTLSDGLSGYYPGFEVVSGIFNNTVVNNSQTLKLVWTQTSNNDSTIIVTGVEIYKNI